MGKNCVNTSVSASKSGQNTAIYSVLCLPRFLESAKPCKYHHFWRSTRQKCCDLWCVFCFAFKNAGICSVLSISSLKNIGIFSIFSVFALLPQKTLKHKNAVIYSALLISKSQKSSETCVKTAHFSDFGYPQNGGGNALGDAYERPGFHPKSSRGLGRPSP